jgi:hypothetical protein
MIKSQQNWLKHKVEQFPLRLINLLFLFGIRRNYLRSVKESIIVHIYTKGDKTDCSNYRGISLLSVAYKILSKMLMEKLIVYAEEIMEENECVFRRNTSTTDHT